MQCQLCFTRRCLHNCLLGVVLTQSSPCALIWCSMLSTVLNLLVPATKGAGVRARSDNRLSLQKVQNIIFWLVLWSGKPALADVPLSSTFHSDANSMCSFLLSLCFTFFSPLTPLLLFGLSFTMNENLHHHQQNNTAGRTWDIDTPTSALSLCLKTKDNPWSFSSWVFRFPSLRVWKANVGLVILYSRCCDLCNGNGLLVQADRFGRNSCIQWMTVISWTLESFP